MTADYNTLNNSEKNFQSIRGSYKTEILNNLSSGRKIFTALQKSIGQISYETLNKKLEELEIDSLINKEYFYSYPARVEYFLTSKGHNYAKLIKQL